MKIRYIWMGLQGWQKQSVQRSMLTREPARLQFPSSWEENPYFHKHLLKSAFLKLRDQWLPSVVQSKLEFNVSISMVCLCTLHTKDGRCGFVGKSAVRHGWRRQRTTSWSQFSPSTFMESWGPNSGFQAYMTSSSTGWAVSSCLLDFKFLFDLSLVFFNLLHHFPFLCPPKSSYVNPCSISYSWPLLL